MTWLVVVLVPLALLVAPTAVRAVSHVLPGARRRAGEELPGSSAPPTALPAGRPVLTARLCVPRSVTGRPGFAVWLPGPVAAAGIEEVELVRAVGLADRAVLMVRVLGPVAACGTATERPARDPAGTGRRRGWLEVGPPEQHEVAAGPVVVHGLGRESGAMVTAWHLDHGGWAFVVEVLTVRGHRRWEQVGAAVVASWAWEDVMP